MLTAKDAKDAKDAKENLTVLKPSAGVCAATSPRLHEYRLSVYCSSLASLASLAVIDFE
jgi:hypothetical protein